MITLVSQPGANTLSKNPIRFTLRVTDGSGNPYGPVGQRATINTSSFFKLLAGDTIVLSWANADGSSDSVTFTAVAAPTAENELYDNTSFHLTFSSYWTDIAAIIQAHHRVAPFLRVFYAAKFGGILLNAEMRESGGIASFGSSTIANSNKVYQQTAEAADNTPSGLKAIVDVFVERTHMAGDYRLAASLSERPSPTGDCVFDIADILDKTLERGIATTLPIPIFNSTTPQLANTTRRYYIRYREEYDGLTSVSWGMTTPKKVLLGGLAQTFANTYDFFANLGASNSLLTWYPTGKEIDRTQPEYLFWYNYTNEEKEIVLEVTEIAEDNTSSSTWAHEANGVSVAPGEVLIIPCGYTQLGLTDEDTREIRVRIADSSVAYDPGTPAYLSQSRRYAIDYHKRRTVRYLQYLNAFGLPETIRCIGSFNNDLEVQRSISSNVNTDNTTAYTREYQFNQAYTNYFTYRTGYVSTEEASALQEMLIYNRAWEVYSLGYIPLVITDSRFQVSDTDEFVRAVRFRATPAIKQRIYSNVQIDVGAETGEGWQTPDSQFWLTAFGEIWETP